MTNVFEGQADARQSEDVKMPTSRFRPAYRALNETEKALHDEIKAKAVELEMIYSRVGTTVPPSRYHALAMTALEESVMWIVKDLTA